MSISVRFWNFFIGNTVNLFFYWLVTQYEMWIPHYNLETKLQSMEWNKKGEPALKSPNLCLRLTKSWSVFSGTVRGLSWKIFSPKGRTLMSIITAIWFIMTYTELYWKNGLGRCAKEFWSNTIMCTPHSQTNSRSNSCQKLGTPAAHPCSQAWHPLIFAYLCQW